MFEADFVQDIVDDFEALNNEIRRELAGDGKTDLMSTMEKENYWEQIQRLKERISYYVEVLQSHLAELLVISKLEKGSQQAENTKVKTILARDLMSQLTALWGRLETLVSLIEANETAQHGKVSQATAGVKKWVSSIGRWLKRVSAQLWNLLGHMLTPKEWKVSGSVGTGVLGLAEASIEVTFGK